jgi:hypothetical protein
LYDIGPALWYVFFQAGPYIKQCQTGMDIPGVKCDEFVKHRFQGVKGKIKKLLAVKRSINFSRN